MLRIIATYELAAETGAAYMLELKGRLEGDWVDELRRTWRPLREAIAKVPVSLAVSEVEFVDAAGKMLLAEMHRAGIDVARGEAAVRPSCAFSGAGHGVGAGSTMSVAG
jgi:ABC-type transporter Mla MlaB component